MKKIIIFFKNLRDKFYIKLIEILLEAEGKKMPKKLEKDLEELKEQFNFFSDLNFSQKVLIILGCIFFLIIVIYWHFALIMMISKAL